MTSKRELRLLQEIDESDEEVEDQQIDKVQDILASLKKSRKGSAPVIKRREYEREAYTIEQESDDSGQIGVKYYYEDPEDFKKFNLPIEKRPWKGGRKAFDNAIKYKPRDLFNYVQHHYLDYFEKQGIPSPFSQSATNIDRTSSEVCNLKEDIRLQPHQKFVGSFMSNQTDFGSLLLYHKLGSGKCQVKDTPIIMYDGSVKMVQDIKVGDLVMGPDSNPRKVMSLATGIDTLYEVIPIKGEKYTFNSEHMLSLKDDNGKIHNISIKDYLKKPNKMKLYRVSVDFQEKQISSDPYTIGLNIKEMNVIPSEYIINSRMIRLDLLSGILDSCGTSLNDSFEFKHENIKIIEQVLYLARSLGFEAYKENTHVKISGNVPVKKLTKPKQKLNLLVTGFKIVEKPKGRYYGFLLDKDHQYLLGDFTVTHNSGSSIAIAESNKGAFLEDGRWKVRKGSKVPKKIIGDRHGTKYEPCHVTVVVPAATIAQYESEIRGKIEHGMLKSFSGSCVIYSEDLEKSGKDYRVFRQFYTGNFKGKDKEPYSQAMVELKKIEKNMSEAYEEFNDLLHKISEGENVDESYQKEIRERIKNLEAAYKKWAGIIEKSVQKVYYIIGQESFLNAVSERKQVGNIVNYVASPYLLGKVYPLKNKQVPHPDCFHSKKAVLIIDEPQKLTSEGGTNFLRLFDTLNFYARDPATGEPRMKVILLTATPIYDNAHEASLMINFQRPRIPFPMARIVFEKFFIDSSNKDDIKLKNKLCYQYLTSGYVSYSQGANPKGFPIRRNIMKLHTMEANQLVGYVNALKYDTSADSSADQMIERSVTKYYDKAYKQALDDNQQGRYLFSRQNCNISYPSIETSSSGSRRPQDQGVREMNELFRKLDTFRDSKNYLAQFKLWSKKFHFIVENIIESSKKKEGPIVVHSEWVSYGILPIIKVLKAIGWNVLENEIDNLSAEQIAYKTRLKRKDNLRLGKLSYGNIAIWSDTAEKALKLSKFKGYKSKVQKLFNDPANKNGDVIKVIFITVNEGVSFKRVSQLHVTSPWWNDSKTEQIIGRGIRFCSHADLPPERQYVDVYYHCSVLPIFKQYPAIDIEIARTIANEILKNKKTNIPVNGINFKDLARLSIEQKVYITSRRKTEINIQFEKALKETAVDCQLNKFGNLVRLEEIVNPLLKIGQDDKVLYDRSMNRYYIYSNGQLQNLKMVTFYEEDKRPTPVWPPLEATVTDQVDTWTQFREDETLTTKEGIKLVSIIVTEEIECFNAKYDMNFKEFMSYAVKEQNEELEVWLYFEDQRMRKELFEVLAGLLGLSEGKGEGELTKLLVENVLSNEKITRGVAFKEQMAKLYRDTNDPELKQIVKKRLETKSLERKPLNNIEFKKAKERQKRLFFIGKDAEAIQYETMKGELISKGYNREYIDKLNPIDVQIIHMDMKYKEREEKK